MEKVESRYQIKERRYGFRVTGTDREPVDVQAVEHGFLVEKEFQRWTDFSDTPETGRETVFVPYIMGHDLVSAITEGLLVYWEPERSTNWSGLSGWVHKKVRTALAARISRQRNRLRGLVGEASALCQQTMFSAIRGASPEVISSRLYKEIMQDTHLRQDLQTYRAFSVAVYHLIQENLFAPQWSTALGRLHSWRSLFAFEGRPYKNLNRTLDHLPGGIPPGMLLNLQAVKLERTIRERSELLLILKMAEPAMIYDSADLRNMKVYLHATADDIRRSLRLLSEHWRRPLSFRGSSDLLEMAGFLRDFPEKHSGGLVGLTEKSIQWHRQFREEQLRQQLTTLKDRPTALPPIGLPDAPGIRFLSSSRSIMEEAVEMEHCVANYLSTAVAGDCYLFHVDYKGRKATVEMAPTGSVQQSFGPRNSVNEACNYGARVLQKWGKGFPLRKLKDPSDLPPLSINDLDAELIPF